MVNKHGLKMTGLKKASGETKDLTGYYSSTFCELFYDTANGEVWTRYQVGNSWTVYHDKNVIACGTTHSPKTMQEIADMVADSFREHETMKKYYESEVTQ